MKENKLIEIHHDQWPVLRDLYSNQRQFASSYNLLQCMIQWRKQKPEFEIKIYSLNGDWQSDGTFLLELQLFNYIYCNSLSENMNRLRVALNCLDSGVDRLMSGFPHRILPVIQQNFHDSNIPNDSFKIDTMLWFHIDKTEALAFSLDDIPATMHFAPLTDSNVEQVNNVWPHQSAGSDQFVKLLIDYNESVGIFENDKLVAWCLRRPLGSLGLLQVEETHKRKGLGSLLVRYMAKMLASKDIEVCASVVITNMASRKMFEKLGFQIIDKVYWAYKPANVNKFQLTNQN